MRKLFFVFLLGIFFAVTNYSKAETLLEFQTRCNNKPESSFHTIPVSFGGCNGIINVCISKIGAPGSYTFIIEYFTIVATNLPCDILSYNNLVNSNFWPSIDDQVIKWASINGFPPVVCTDVSYPNLVSYYEISKRPCQKIVNLVETGNNAPIFTRSLVPCGGLENTCFKTYVVCRNPMSGLIQIIPGTTTMIGSIDCSTTIPNTTQQFVWNSEGQYFDILFDPTANWETECFSMGCN